MDTPSGCRIKMLARSKLCAVEYCHGCGMFHVSLGMVSLRFKLAALHTVSDTLVAALETHKSQHNVAPTKILPFKKPDGQIH